MPFPQTETISAPMVDQAKLSLLPKLLQQFALAMTQRVGGPPGAEAQGGSVSTGAPGSQVSPQAPPQVPVSGPVTPESFNIGPAAAAMAMPVAQGQPGYREPQQPRQPMPVMPTSFENRQERQGASVQYAIRSLGQVASTLVRRSREKKATQAEAVTVAMLTGGQQAKQSSPEERERVAKLVESKAPKIKQIINAIQSGDFEEIAKHAGTPEWEGVQRGVTKVANMQEFSRQRQQEQRTQSMDLAKLIRENQESKARIANLTAEAEAYRSGAKAPLPNTVDVMIPGPDGKSVATKMQLNKETGRYDIPVGPVAPDEPVIDTKPFGEILPALKNLGSIPRTSFQAIVGGLFDKATEEQRQAFLAKENDLNRKNDLAIAKLRQTQGPDATRFDLLPPDDRSRLVDYTVRQIAAPDGIRKWNELTAGDSGLQSAVRNRLSEFNVDVQQMETGAKQIMDSSKAMTTAIDGLLTKMGATGGAGADARKQSYEKLLGPFSGRWSELMAGTVGEATDPAYADLRTTVSLISSGTMRAHVGLRGGQMLLERFDNLLGAKFMNYETLVASMKAMKNFLQDAYITPYEGRGGSPSPLGAPAAPQGDLGGTLDRLFGPAPAAPATQ